MYRRFLNIVGYQKTGKTLWSVPFFLILSSMASALPDLLGCVNADALSSLSADLKLYVSFDKSVKSVVGTYSDVGAGMKFGASLSYNDVAGDNMLAAELLDAQALGLAVTSVLCGTDSLFMCKKL